MRTTEAALRIRRLGVRFPPSALTVDDAGSWASLQVDFLIVSRRTDGTLAASIVDRHGDRLADAKGKLRALSDSAVAVPYL